MLSKVSILGVFVTTSKKEEILSFCKTRLHGTRVTTIVTPNPEQILLAQKNPAFQNILNDADIALPDGVGLRIANKKIKEIIHGREFLVDLCKAAAEQKKKVLFIGSRGGVAKRALVTLQSSISHLSGIGLDGSELSENKEIPSSFIDELIHTIRGNNISCVFLGFGAPKQEFLMEKLKGALSQARYSNPIMLMVVGGSFNMISGTVPIAPQWIQNMELEWLYRLIREPWRIVRQLSLLKFLWMVLTK